MEIDFMNFPNPEILVARESLFVPSVHQKVLLCCFSRLAALCALVLPKLVDHFARRELHITSNSSDGNTMARKSILKIIWCDISSSLFFHFKFQCRVFSRSLLARILINFYCRRSLFHSFILCPIISTPTILYFASFLHILEQSP